MAGGHSLYERAHAASTPGIFHSRLPVIGAGSDVTVAATYLRCVLLKFRFVLPARPEIRESATFAITVDFVRGKGDPSRPFRTMIDLMDALARFDRDLIRSVDVTIEPVLLLEDVEAGSIKSWVATVLKSTDDDAIRSGDWKKVVGDYLVKGKYLLLEKLEGVDTITQPRLLDEIQSGLLLEAEQTNVRALPGYVPMSRTRIAAHVADVTASLEYLEEGDTASYESRDGNPVPFNTHIRVDEAEISEMLAARTITNDVEMILKVKKPDFLGNSMWEFNHEGHPISASILDQGWLADFREHGLGVRPGVALRALVRVEASYDDDSEALPARYAVLKVYEVIPPKPPSEQLYLPTPSS